MREGNPIGGNYASKQRGANQPHNEENGMKRMIVLQAAFLAKQADRLFTRAAKAWERGNNSGNSEALDRGERQCDRYRMRAEALLKPLGIAVDYPGLYPSFTVNGHSEHSTLNAVSAALEGTR